MKSINKFLTMAFCTVMSFIITNKAYAAVTAGDIAKTVSDQIPAFATATKYIALLVGVVLIIMGVNDLRKSPQERQGSISSCFLKIGSGVILCSIGWFVEVGTSSLGGSGSELTEILN